LRNGVVSVTHARGIFQDGLVTISAWRLKRRNVWLACRDANDALTAHQQRHDSNVAEKAVFKTTARDTQKGL